MTCSKWTGNARVLIGPLCAAGWRQGGGLWFPRHSRLGQPRCETGWRSVTTTNRVCHRRPGLKGTRHRERRGKDLRLIQECRGNFKYKFGSQSMVVCVHFRYVFGSVRFLHSVCTRASLRPLMKYSSMLCADRRKETWEDKGTCFGSSSNN